MLHENAGAHEHENGAAHELGLALEAGAEHTAHPGAQRGQGKGDDADEAHSGNDVHLQEGEGDAHGQCVDAGGDGQRQHGPETEAAVEALLLVLPGLTDHVQTDQTQQGKGDPVVDADDDGLKAHAQQPAQQGHHALKQAKIPAAGQGVGRADTADGQTLADGDGEGVHGQSNGDDEQLPQTHNMYPPNQMYRRAKEKDPPVP